MLSIMTLGEFLYQIYCWNTDKVESVGTSSSSKKASKKAKKDIPKSPKKVWVELVYKLAT